jgi:hypothetical protein
MDAQNDIPFFGRQVFHKHVYQKPPRVVNDDVWTFNTQSSSQCTMSCTFDFQTHTENIQGTAFDTSHIKKKQNSTTE